MSHILWVSHYICVYLTSLTPLYLNVSIQWTVSCKNGLKVILICVLKWAKIQCTFIYMNNKAPDQLCIYNLFRLCSWATWSFKVNWYTLWVGGEGGAGGRGRGRVVNYPRVNIKIVWGVCGGGGGGLVGLRCKAFCKGVYSKRKEVAPAFLLE